jgi:monoamine oxidase
VASSRVDLVIVGAGAAGIAAARTAAALGRSFVVVEAMDRIGGRMHTDTSIFGGVPWDLGAHWLHSASINCLREVADRLAYPYDDGKRTWRIVHTADGLARRDADGEADAAVTAAYDAAAAAGFRGDDVPVTAVVDTASPHYPLFRTMIAAEWGVEPDRASTIDIARYRDTHENYPVPAGYGALLARLAAEVPVSLRTPVTEIFWAGPDVRVVTSDGTITARRVLITVSTSALAAGGIRFTPELPAWKQEAIAAVPLGRDNKVVFQVTAPIPGVAEPMTVLTSLPGGGGLSFQVHAHGTNLVIGFIGGDLARDGEEQGAALEIGRAGLKHLFGADVERLIGAEYATAWGQEPTIRGAYAAALPGKAHLRRWLATPIDDRLYFAGEATSPEFFSTAHGAWISGVEATRSASQSLG